MAKVIDQTTTSCSSTKPVSNYMIQVQNIDYAELELRIIAHLKDLGYTDQQIKDNLYVI